MKKTMVEKLISLLDLTALPDETEPDPRGEISALCLSSQTPYGIPAALCVPPQSVKLTQARLCSLFPNASYRPVVATVVNFPNGLDTLEKVLTDISFCLQQGAQEIDCVIPLSLLRENSEKEIARFLKEVVTNCKANDRFIKFIIESGVLTQAQVHFATQLVCESGADFVKTSTGKVPGAGADRDSVETILSVLADRKKKGFITPGIKVSGGVTLKNIVDFLTLIETWMGSAWVSPERTRFGSSKLIRELLAQPIH